MADGILWQLVGNIDPLGRYTQGLDQGLRRRTFLEQLAGQREDRQFNRERDTRNFSWQQQEAQRNQGNWEKQFGQSAANQNQMRAIQAAQLDLARKQFARGEIPAGFERDPNNPNALRPIAGGDKSPEYVRSITEAKPTKPVPFGVQNAEAEDLSGINSINTINDELGGFAKKIGEGKLYLGPAANLASRVRNIAGASNEQSRNFASFQATLERLRNESLRLNKGVQTEGDSQRAWNELIANINDPQVVQQRIAEIQGLNKRAADFKRNMVMQRREDNRLPSLDFNRVLGASQSNTQNPPRIQSRQDMMRLPPGSKFIWTDGSEWTVPTR